MLVDLVDFILCGVNQEYGSVGKIPAMGVPNLVGILTIIFSRMVALITYSNFHHSKESRTTQYTVLRAGGGYACVELTRSF